jgi:hypothetical protein
MSSLSKQVLVGGVAALLLAGAGFADKDGSGAVRFESGGATYEAFDEMNQRANDYSLKLLLAAKGSGAYLADVDVSIVSLPQRENVLQHHTEGPLLLAALPPGRYEISASFPDVRPGAPTTVKRTVIVPRSGIAQTVLYFDTGDDVAQ